MSIVENHLFFVGKHYIMPNKEKQGGNFTLSVHFLTKYILCFCATCTMYA